MVDKLDWIWMDGEMVRWEDARVHILTHTIHYGTGAFEGIRAYRRDSGETQVFRLREHIDRLFDSAKMLQLKMPFTRAQVVTACLELVRANKTESCYLRPLVFLGDEAMGLYAPNNTVHVSVVSWRWGAYLGEEALKKGIRAKVSSYARGHINATMAKGKISGHYVNSILAKREAKSGGYDEAIMLDTQGYVAEASGENLFMVKNGEIRTPDLGSAILAGITRDAIITLAREMGIKVTEGRIARDELWTADEVFLTGTAAELTPVREIDDRTVGEGAMGPITAKLQARFFDVVKGTTPDHAGWRAVV
jgi:branched-chain amino acid aminotransferase